MLDGSNGERDTIYRGRERGREGTTRARTKTTFPDRQRESLEMRLESIRIHLLLLLGIPSSLPFLFIASISLLLNGGMAAGVSSDGGIWEMGVSSSLRILLTFIQGLERRDVDAPLISRACCCCTRKPLAPSSSVTFFVCPPLYLRWREGNCFDLGMDGGN